MHIMKDFLKFPKSRAHKLPFEICDSRHTRHSTYWSELLQQTHIYLWEILHNGAIQIAFQCILRGNEKAWWASDLKQNTQQSESETFTCTQLSLLHTRTQRHLLSSTQIVRWVEVTATASGARTITENS